MKMKKLYKAALLAALGLAGVPAMQAATYNGDLLVGFTSGTGNDFIYDLGAAGSLSDGQTWDLSSYLTSYTLSSVNWGVIGDKNVSGTRYVWSSTDGSAANTVSGTAAWGNIDTGLKSIYQNFATTGAGSSVSIVSTDDNSWYQQTINGALALQYHNSYGLNPNVVGLTSDTFYSVVANGSSPVAVGSFTLDNAGILTYNGIAPVPEPSSLALLGGGALLMITLRNKIRRK